MAKFIVFVLILGICIRGNTKTTTSPFSFSQKLHFFSLTDRNYEDTRIDTNGDHKADYWKVKKGPITVEQYELNGKVYYHIKGYTGTIVKERLIERSGKNLILHYAVDRHPIIYNFSSQSPLCEDNHVAKWTEFKENIGDISQKMLSKATSRTLGDCKEKMPDSYKETFSKVLQSILSPGNAEPNKFLDCIENKTESLFLSTYPDEGFAKAQHKKAIVGYKNTIIEFVNSATGTEEPFFVCENVSDNSLPPMQMEEGKDGGKGKIKINLSQKSSQSSSDEVTEQLLHEVIHKSSVENEVLVKKVTALCLAKELPTDTESEYAAVSFKSVPITVEVTDASQNLAQNAPQTIPVTAAETPIPASPVDMNRLADNAGPETTRQVSEQHTSGIVLMAESVLATPAVAAPDSSSNLSGNSAPSSSYASDYSSGSGGSRRRESRSPASNYKLDTETVTGSSSAATKTLNGIKSRGLGRDEYIKEEIDLTKSAVPNVQQRQQTRVPTTRAIASEASTASASMTNDSELGNSTGASGSPIPPARSSELQGPSPTNSGRTSRQPTTRAPSNYVPSRDEVVSFFTSGTYAQARSKLTDQNFINTLKQNSITVYDLGGNQYGADRGQIIFVDQGDRFVRQK